VHRPGVRGLNVGGGGEHTNCRKKSTTGVDESGRADSGKRLMGASDLIGCDVYDGDGADVGKVHDLRFEADGASGV